MTEKLPTSLEETIDFIYECQNMADATAKAEVLWPVLRSAAASAEPETLGGFPPPDVAERAINGAYEHAARLRGASAEPVAWITKASLDHWRRKGTDADTYMLLRSGNDMRTPLYTHPAPDAEIVAALEDVFSHQDVWRRLLVAQQTPIGSDDDGSYWAHELKVFDRIFAALTKAKGGSRT